MSHPSGPRREQDPRRNEHYNALGGQYKNNSRGNGRDNCLNQRRNHQESHNSYNHDGGRGDNRQNNTRNQPQIISNIKIMRGAISKLEDKATTGEKGLTEMANNRATEAREYAGQTKMEEQQGRGQPRRNHPSQRQQSPHGPPEMWQDQSGGEADLDTSDSEALEDAPPLQQEPTEQPYFLQEETRQQRRQPSASGPKNQTVQAWEQQQRQKQQSQPVYEEWAQGHDHILREGIDSWEQIQRDRVEQQRESLYHLYCEAEKARRLARQQDPKQKAHYQESSLPMYRESSILQLLLYTTALQQALQTTFTLLTTYETHLAHSEQRAADLSPLHAFFDAVDRTVARTAEMLDMFWRSAQRADANRGAFRLAGRAAQVEFCRAWEAVVWGCDAADNEYNFHVFGSSRDMFGFRRRSAEAPDSSGELPAD
ncbi:hypothetical protein B0I37DRAFT_355314 [Chaetomium sp. MPI-CAGE-AT-0009]|nr:hypothetical protein B0I37DRAFT_355314 [Chaetomium sp. MPI-CAGE-AT-0009]